jgi:hypothetical protein
MKRLRTIFAAAALLLATSAFAASGPEKVSPSVKAAFEKNFSGAVNVNWQKNDDFYFASFMLNSKETSVAYNETGELLGIARATTTLQLPLNVSLALANKYANFTVSETVTELTYLGETSYYVFAENNKQILKLKCYSDGDITVENRTKK